MKKSHKRKLLKTKLLNYVSSFVRDLDKVHQDTKAKYKTEDEEYLVDDYLFTFTEDINDIKKAYEADESGEALDKLWNGSYNYNMEED
tara:strand:- start:892 stop:1155 length:264 start_codon:yes stop_codon:yes gene_type:complete